MRMYCFVDGAYLRCIARRSEKPLADPRALALELGYSGFIQSWRLPGIQTEVAYVGHPNVMIFLDRIVYYDGQIALLIAGDADFVPIVQAVRRKGVLVAIAAVHDSLSSELREVADRVHFISPDSAGSAFPSLVDGDNRCWFVTDGGQVERRAR